MKKQAWNDKQLEELLYKMPKIEDQRDPQEIYQNISLKMNKRKKTIWIMPTLATAAALLLFVILAPAMMNSQQSAEKVEDKGGRTASQADMQLAKVDQQNDSANKEVAVSKEKTENQEAAEQKVALDQEKESEQQSLSTNSIVTDDDLTAIYDNNLAGKEVITYAIPDANAQTVVPVSVLVNQEGSKTMVQLFEETMPKLQEESWGLGEYYPLQASLDFSEDNKTVNIDLPENHPYGMGSASQVMFENSLNETLQSLGIERVTLSTEGNQGAMFGELGEKTEFNITASNKQAYYFYFPNENAAKPFIVPSTAQYDSVGEALKAMKQNIPELNLKASIPKGVEIKNTNESGDILTVEVAENTQLNNDASSLHMIEAILLTAKDFQFDTVKIQNTNITEIGNFNLQDGMKVPVAPNKRAINE